jgi:hypothetical protein
MLHEKNHWSEYSRFSIIAFINITIFTILQTRFNYQLYAFAVFVPIILWPFCKMLFDELHILRKIKDKIKEKWNQFPSLVHKGISAVCFFWSLFLIFGIILPLLKKDYVKNKR